MGKKMINVTFSDIGGDVDAPPSKSYMQRYALLSSFLDGSIKIINPGFSDDDLVSISVAESCGKTVSRDGGNIVIQGRFRKPAVINAKESGTSFRLVQGLLASTRSTTRIFLGKSLMARPMNPLVSALSPHGYLYSRMEDSVLIDASQFSCPDSFEIDGSVSSQFISSLMLCLAMSRKEHGTIHIGNGISSEGYIHITSGILQDFGCRIQTGNTITVHSPGMILPEEARIEGDYSSSAFLLVMGILLSDRGITVRKLPANSFQPDMQILEILRKYLKISRYGDLMDITAFRQDTGRVVIDVGRTPDLAPPLSVLGMFSEEGIEIKNPLRLRTKESDRYGAIIDLARSTGAVVELDDDSLIIRRGNAERARDLPERDDHRIVMAKFLASSVIGKRFQVHFQKSVNKSFPEFWDYAAKLGFRIDLK